MASDLFSTVRGHFKIEDIDSDNWLFKLYYKASFGICLAGSILCAASAYIGNPITCDHQHVPSQAVVEQYCWLHGSYSIPEKYHDHFGCKTEPSRSYTEKVTTAYYQWVVFVLLLSAILFLLPRKIWKILEGGTIAHFGTDAKSAFVLADGETTGRLVNTYVRFFNVIKYKSDRYFANFVLCEVLNVGILIFNFCLTNVFLNYDFASYGANVVSYYQLNKVSRDEEVNPMCNIFPTK